jgi:hypothetical protein
MEGVRTEAQDYAAGIYQICKTDKKNKKRLDNIRRKKTITIDDVIYDVRDVLLRVYFGYDRDGSNGVLRIDSIHYILRGKTDMYLYSAEEEKDNIEPISYDGFVEMGEYVCDTTYFRKKPRFVWEEAEERVGYQRLERGIKCNLFVKYALKCGIIPEQVYVTNKLIEISDTIKERYKTLLDRRKWDKLTLEAQTQPYDVYSIDTLALVTTRNYNREDILYVPSMGLPHLCLYRTSIVSCITPANIAEFLYQPGTSMILLSENNNMKKEPSKEVKKTMEEEEMDLNILKTRLDVPKTWTEKNTRWYLATVLFSYRIQRYI